ncbi:MAG: LysR substrate-binding domain-containing protein, partial [Cypionkella sp.]
NNGDFLEKLAIAGEGIALLPRFITAEALASGQLMQVLPDWSAPDIWLTLYYAPFEKLPARIATFSDFFEKHVQATAFSHPQL